MNAKAAARLGADGTLCHFEDADGHVVEPAQVTMSRRDSEFWAETKNRNAFGGVTRFGPCRIGLTFRIRRMKPRNAWWIQSAEIAEEVTCIFDSDGEVVFGPCQKCGRVPPGGYAALAEEALEE